MFWGGVLQLTGLQKPLWANSDCFICPGEYLQSGLCFILIYKSSLKGTIFSTAFTKAEQCCGSRRELVWFLLVKTPFVCCCRN